MHLKDLGNLEALINIFNTKGSSSVGEFFDSLNNQSQKFIVTSGKLSELQLGMIKGNVAWEIGTDGVKKTLNGLSEAELDAAVNAATMSAAQKSATVSINLNTMSKIGNTASTKAQISEDTKNLLLKGNLITAEQLQSKATVKLTKDKIMSSVASGTLTKAEGEQLISTLGLTGGLSVAFTDLWASIKKTTAAMWTFLTTTPAGWATLAVGAIGAVVAGVYAYNKSIDKAVDNAKENLSELSTEYDEVTSSIEANNAKIKELESLRDSGNLSIVDDEDLTELEAQNRELAIRQEYLEKQQELANQDIVDAAKKKYNKDYGNQDTNESNINAYKDELDKPKPVSNTASSYLTGGGGSQYQSTPYAAGQQAQLNAENDTIAALIAQYQHYEEEIIKAENAKDSEALEKYNAKLSETSGQLMANRTGLQQFRDDLSLTGESSAELDDVNNKLGLIDKTLLEKGHRLIEFINTKSFADQKSKLVELADTGKLTADTLAEGFPELDAYLAENGVSFEHLIGVIKTYRDELTSEQNTSQDLFISDTITQLNTQLKPAFDSLKSAYQDIFTTISTSELSVAMKGLNTSLVV